MPDFEMPYFVDGGGNKGYFKDSTAREQIEDIMKILKYDSFDPSKYPSWDDFPYISIGYGYVAQTNSPGFNGFVFCFGGAAHRTQIAFSSNLTNQKYRTFISGAWSAWSSFVDETARSQIATINSDLTPIPFTLTLSDTLTNITRLNQRCYYIPATGEVRIQLLVFTPDGNIPVNNRTIATIPAAYKPKQVEQFMVGLLGNTSNNPAQLEAGYIETSGNIKFNNFVYGDKPANWVYLNFSYLI